MASSIQIHHYSSIFMSLHMGIVQKITKQGQVTLVKNQNFKAKLNLSHNQDGLSDQNEPRFAKTALNGAVT